MEVQSQQQGRCNTDTAMQHRYCVHRSYSVDATCMAVRLLDKSWGNGFLALRQHIVPLTPAWLTWKIREPLEKKLMRS